jgi:hypothetical protein
MPPPIPGDAGAAGRTGCAIGGVTGFGAGAGAGLGAAAIGLAAAAGLRAGALRAGLRAAAFLAGLRAEVFFAADLRAVARFAVFRAGAFFLAPAFLAVVLRALALLVLFRPVVRFFPLFFVAMADAPILLRCRTRPLKPMSVHDSCFTDPGLPSRRQSQRFFSLYADRSRKWQSVSRLEGDARSWSACFQTKRAQPATKPPLHSKNVSFYRDLARQNAGVHRAEPRACRLLKASARASSSHFSAFKVSPPKDRPCSSCRGATPCLRAPMSGS